MMDNLAHLIWVILASAKGRNRTIFLGLSPVEDVLVFLRVLELGRHIESKGPIHRSYT